MWRWRVAYSVISRRCAVAHGISSNAWQLLARSSVVASYQHHQRRINKRAYHQHRSGINNISSQQRREKKKRSGAWQQTYCCGMVVCVAYVQTRWRRNTGGDDSRDKHGNVGMTPFSWYVIKMAPASAVGDDISVCHGSRHQRRRLSIMARYQRQLAAAWQQHGVAA